MNKLHSSTRNGLSSIVRKFPFHKFFVDREVRLRCRPVKRLIDSLQSRYPSLFMKELPIESLLMGGEGGLPSATYARLTKDPLRPSTPISQSPHVNFLEMYDKIGEKIFTPSVLEKTPYYLNALKCIELCGHYFGHTQPKGIHFQARTFADFFNGAPIPSERPGRSSVGSPVEVCPIPLSGGCFEVIDGQHRLSLAWTKGRSTYPCIVALSETAFTPLQQLILDSTWTKGRHELYQPIDFPELKADWKLVRKCTDRIDMMKNWLSINGLKRGDGRTYVDIGSSYGWFVSEFIKLGFSSIGIERDPASNEIGRLAFGLDQECLVQDDIVRFLSQQNKKFDVVSCFSVLHHFILRPQSISAEKFIKLVDDITETVLFLDTGESHEEWFAESLPQWTVHHIEHWITSNTTFTSVKALGKDKDGIGIFEKNYGRTLFVCTR